MVGQSEPCVISSVSSTDRERLESSHHSSENVEEAELQQLINGIVGDIPSEDSVFLDDFGAPGTSVAASDSATHSRVYGEKSKKPSASVSETLSIDIPRAKLRMGCIRFKCALNLGHVTKMGKLALSASLGCSWSALGRRLDLARLNVGPWTWAALFGLTRHNCRSN